MELVFIAWLYVLCMFIWVVFYEGDGSRRYAKAKRPEPRPYTSWKQFMRDWLVCVTAVLGVGALYALVAGVA